MEPSVKAPGFELQDRAGAWGWKGWLSDPRRRPSNEGQETPHCGQGSSGPIPHIWTPTRAAAWCSSPLLPSLSLPLRGSGAEASLPTPRWLPQSDRAESLLWPCPATQAALGYEYLIQAVQKCQAVFANRVTGRKKLRLHLCRNHCRLCYERPRGPEKTWGLQPPWRSGKARQNGAGSRDASVSTPQQGALHSPSLPGGHGHSVQDVLAAWPDSVSSEHGAWSPRL